MKAVQCVTNTLSIPEDKENLGLGGFAEVFLAAGAAWKKVPIPTSEEDQRKRAQEFRTEVEVLKSCQSHPYIIELLDYSKTPTDYYVVMEAGDIDLYTWLDPKAFHQLGQAHYTLTLNRYFQHTASAMQFLHQTGYIHRDIKPTNVVLVKGTAKLIDFGLACKKNTFDLSRLYGTIAYMAPEYFRYEGDPIAADSIAPEKTDTYSFGLLMLACLVGKHPYHNLRSIPQIGKSKVAGKDPSLMRLLDDNNPIKALIKLCIHSDNAQRPNDQQLCDKLNTVLMSK